MLVFKRLIAKILFITYQILIWILKCAQTQNFWFLTCYSCNTFTKQIGKYLWRGCLYLMSSSPSDTWWGEGYFRGWHGLISLNYSVVMKRITYQYFRSRKTYICIYALVIYSLLRQRLSFKIFNRYAQPLTNQNEEQMIRKDANS